ncbi:hypothetical protein [Actinomadura sp. 9N407]|uniref:hypothetical protein n=1 Tax=Actinomadura sp. 9N407 TaxID=3375154 RepID=UPI003794AC93
MTHSLHRLTFTGLAAFAFLAAAPAAAIADASHSDTGIKTEKSGAFLHVRSGFVADDGRAYVRDSYYWAGAGSASIRRVDRLAR